MTLIFFIITMGLIYFGWHLIGEAIKDLYK